MSTERNGQQPAALVDAAFTAVEAVWQRRPTSIRRVSSDVEETFLVAFADGVPDDPATPDRAVLKVAEPGRQPDWFAFEAFVVDEALRRAPELPLARSIPAADGSVVVTTTFAGAVRSARLMQQLSGAASHETTPDAAARRRIGRTAGRLSRALADIDHAVAHRRVPWDLRDLSRLAGAVEMIPDPRAREAVARILSGHRVVLEVAAELPAQLSHNDLNGGNILVSPVDAGDVVGIIDFGDAAFAPRVLDVGIAAAYAAAEAAAAAYAAAEAADAAVESAWSAAASLTLGYRDVVALTADEVALVPAIVRARLAQRVLVAASRSAAGTPPRDNESWLRAAQVDLLAVVDASPTAPMHAPKEWR